MISSCRPAARSVGRSRAKREHREQRQPEGPSGGPASGAPFEWFWGPGSCLERAKRRPLVAAMQMPPPPPPPAKEVARALQAPIGSAARNFQPAIAIEQLASAAPCDGSFARRLRKVQRQ